MNANRPAIGRTPSESGNFRARSAEGIYKTKMRSGFDHESPTRTDLFAFICTYLRVFALKTFFFLSLRNCSPIPSRAMPDGRDCTGRTASEGRKLARRSWVEGG